MIESRGDTTTLIQRARELESKGTDADALAAWVDVLKADPTHLDALNALGNLAFATGRRAAARTTYEQAVRCHPDDATARVNLGNLLYYEEDLPSASAHYEAALALDPQLPEAHQGMARVLDAQGDTAAAEPHWRQGFAGRAFMPQRYRGTVPPVRVLLLVSVKLGNVGTRQFLDDRTFEVTAAHAEFIEPDTPLPPHDLVFNAIGDADLCALALAQATAVIARTAVPVLNRPEQVRLTGRTGTTKLFADLPGVVLPRVRQLPRAVVPAEIRDFPMLLRAVGFHTGRYFVRVERSQDLAPALAALPGEDILVIEPLDARGADGMHRKYRVMIIDGELYPLHLAISHDWKVHYFTGAMQENPAYREEELRFLQDMPGVLGARAMSALTAIAQRMGLDYGGVDFALAPDGSLLLFEANATMAILMPGRDPLWDYRRPAIQRALDEARKLVLRRAESKAR